MTIPLHLLGVLFLAIILRGVLLLAHSSYALTGDDASYAWQAVHILNGDWADGLGTYFPPAYPAAIALCALFTGGDAALAGRLVSIVASVGLVLAIFSLTACLYGPAPALFAALVAALYPRFLEFGAVALSEMLYTLLLGTGALFVIRLAVAVDGRKSFALQGLAAGVFLGLAYLTRPEGIAFVGVATVIVLVVSLAAYHPAPRSLVPVACLIAGAAIFVLPYALFLHTSLGHWTISGKEGNLALGIAVASGTNPEEALFSLTDDGSRLIGDTQLARQQPSLLRAVRTYADNLYHEQGPLVEVLPLPLLALAFLGLIHEPLNREQRLGRFVIVTFIMLYLLVYPLLFVFARLLVPLVGLVIPSLACGTQDLQSRCSPTLKYASRPHGFRYRVRSVVARHYLEIGVVFVLVILGIGYQAQALAEPKFHSVVSAGRWFVEHGESSAVVMATHGSGISYYGRLDQYALMTPYAEYPRLLDYAYLRNVEYLVVEERLIGLRPMQRSLLNWGQHPAELVPVYVDESERDHAVVIYRVSRESASRMHAQAAGQGQARP